MDAFKYAIQWILPTEGGFVNDPADTGGATNHGITQATYDDWQDEQGEEKKSVARISGDDVVAIYREKYWDAEACNVLPPKTAVCVFDFAVNSGPAVAVKHLQKLVGSEQDGVIGPRTVALVQGFTDDALANKYLDDHMAFYEACVKGNPRDAKFKDGWLARISNLRKFIATIKQ